MRRFSAGRLVRLGARTLNRVATVQAFAVILLAAGSARAEDALRLHDASPESLRAPAAMGPQTATLVIFALASLVAVLLALFIAMQQRSGNECGRWTPLS